MAGADLVLGPDDSRHLVKVVRRALGDDVQVIAGSTDGNFAALYFWEGRLRGALGVNMPRVVMPFRQLLSERAHYDEAIARATELTA